MMPRLRRSVVAAIGPVLIAGSSQAQPAPADSPSVALCFRGRPLPTCRSFLLTEFGGGFRLRYGPYRYTAPLFSYEVGWVRNLDRQWAFGGSAFGEGADEGAVLGLRPRVRYWASPSVSVDIAPGAALFNRHLAFSGAVALGVADRFALTTTVHILPATPALLTEGHATQYTWYGGARFGSLWGVLTGLSFPIAILGYIALCGCID